ncbi:hypothetical protein MK805_15420 [Shimazuella sp. AN120528]|uniref:hypothetical protein n=1 Tax=Shimazuella soli TaxID=1892854 RepID=UPI001F0FA980|nr:hypothetical protein [Shimazuella soli]MCH5586332.1 hypothetical protein [Shimazuella soli]
MRFLPEEELKRLYLEEFYTIADLIFYYGCSQKTIKQNFQLYQIPVNKRGNFLYRKLQMSEKKFASLLKELYWIRRMSTYEIAEYLEVSQQAIWMNMVRFNLIRRKC